MLTRNEQKEKTRHGLIQAAEKLFSRDGIAVTSTAHVAKAMKLSHGSVFVHFPKREDLILAVIDDFGVRLAAEFESALSREATLEGILKAHLKTLSAFEDFYYRLLSELPALPDSVRSVVFMLNAAVSWKMFEAAKPEMAKGKIKRMERHWFFNTWMAILHYTIVNREQLSSRTPILREKGKELAEHFLELIRQ